LIQLFCVAPICTGFDGLERNGIPIYLLRNSPKGPFFQMPFSYDDGRKRYNYQMHVGQEAYVACPGSTQAIIISREIDLPFGNNVNTFMVRCNPDGLLTTNLQTKIW
jgi:hypothetical protein